MLEGGPIALTVSKFVDNGGYKILDLLQNGQSPGHKEPFSDPGHDLHILQNACTCMLGILSTQLKWPLQGHHAASCSPIAICEP